MKKRILSILMTVILILGLSAAAYADDSMEITLDEEKQDVSTEITMDDDTGVPQESVSDEAEDPAIGAAYDEEGVTLGDGQTEIALVKLGYTSKVYAGKELKPPVTVKAVVNGVMKTIKKGVDYTVTYKNNVNVGTAKVIVSGKGNFTGTITKKFKIKAAPLKSVSTKYYRLPYTGYAMKMTGSIQVKAKVGGQIITLEEGKDYKVSYKNNKKPGKATLTVTGKGNFKGQLKKKFNIVKAGIIDPSEKWDLYDGLVSQIRNETNPKTRTALMHKAEDMLMETYAVIPIRYYGTVGTYFFAFNVKAGLFDGLSVKQARNVRKAISLLIDRQKVSDDNYPVANTFVPIGMDDGNGKVFHKNLNGGYFDPYAINDDPAGTLAQARKLLKSAGYKFGKDGKLSAETPLKFTYIFNDQVDHKQIAASVKKDLAKIGIKMSTSSVKWKTLESRWASGRFTASRGGWVIDEDETVGPCGMLEMAMTESDGNVNQFGK